MTQNILKNIVCLVLLSATTVSYADTESRVQYLANEGVAVFHGETTLLFDPLFQTRNAFYAQVPEETREAIIKGSEPFSNITAIFVSHYHLDHFDPDDMLKLMAQQDTTQLYAPQQAVNAMRFASSDDQAYIFERVIALDLDYGDVPQLIQNGNLTVQGFYIPHSGWPRARTDVENIAFRVTIDNAVTVVHLGDADARSEHFAPHQHEWQEKEAGVALPPYWFFDSADGNDILDTYIHPLRTIGIHVPAAYRNPENMPKQFQDFDLFTRPGETRPLVATPQ
jgi:L-ascorbate metabolism protein UlaG (beta-lactamase superfamily)